MRWLTITFRPGSRPFHRLAGALIPLLEPRMGASERQAETTALAESLRQGALSLSDVVDRILQRSSPANRLLLVADQLEQLYTLCPEPEVRCRFLDVLLSAVGAGLAPALGTGASPAPTLTLVLTMRADFMGQALAYCPFAETLQGADLLLGPMTRPQMERAIEEPARGRV